MIPLSQQRATVDQAAQELLSKGGGRRQAERDFQVARLRAAGDTLAWLETHGEALKAFVASLKQSEATA